jgi:cytidine deaminase
MDLDQRLVDAAIDQMDRRWPATEQAVAAAVYLDNGQILTGVSLDNLNAAATLCAETGVLCQAYTLNRQVTASVCVSRDAGSSDVNILAPCGICQERLALWGPAVQLAVADPADASRWIARTLFEVNPFYWGARFADGGTWPSLAVHIS